MNWLKFIFGNWKRITNIEVVYLLTTESGNKILDISENLLPNKIIVNRSEWEYFKTIKELEDKYKDIFYKRARELLVKYKEKNLNKVRKGYLYSGDYIVGCAWTISFDSEPISWKEYKETHKLWYLKERKK
jgi:hypothetical protein